VADVGIVEGFSNRALVVSAREHFAGERCPVLCAFALVFVKGFRLEGLNLVLRVALGLAADGCIRAEGRLSSCCALGGNCMRFSVVAFFCTAAVVGQQQTEGVRELVLTYQEGEPPKFLLRNAYRSPATVWVVGCKQEKEGKWQTIWHRANQNLTLEPKVLAPGQEVGVTIPAGPAAMGKQECKPFRLIAALFADGTVTGDYRWISSIVADQKAVREDVEKAVEMLKNAVGNGSAKADVLVQFEEWRQKIPQLGGRRPEPSPGSTVAFGSATGDMAVVGEIAPPRPMLFLRSSVPGAAVWLMTKKEKSPAETLEALKAWQERLTPSEWGLSGPVPVPVPGPDVPKGLQTSLMTRGAESEMVGKPAPEFTLKDVEGKEVSLKSLRGKAVFLDFWATWCAPCRDEMPQIQALHDEFQAKGLVVLAINSSESAEVAKEYFRAQRLTFRNVMDPENAAHKLYGAGGIPKAVLIDKKGVVRFFQEGWSSDQDFRREVKKLGL
jgi:peroxiredoxin